MILFALKIYEFVQILFLNSIKFLNFFIKNAKLNHFVSLRDPKCFLNTVAQTDTHLKALKAQTGDRTLKLFWFHVASAGELEQAIPLASVLHKKLNAFFFVTYYSPSAEPFLKNFPWCLGACGLPIDSLAVYQRACTILPFEKIFFVRYDLWPALVLCAKKYDIELNLLCATAQKTTLGWRAKLSQRWNFFLYKKFKNIFVSTQQDYNYFHHSLPHQNVIFAGDTKWRRALERAQAFREQIQSQDSRECPNRFVKFFRSVENHIKKNTLKCVVFGSPHKQEHEIALKCIAHLKSLFVIYVPHHVTRESCDLLRTQIQKSGATSCFYSENKINDTTNAVIFDETGHLAEIYALADVAVIGGGFDGQIHNLLEACAHGVAVLIGSNFSRAPEVRTLVDAHVALSFQKPNLLFQFLAQWVNLKEDMKQLKYAHKQAIELFNNIPNTNQIILDTFLKEIQYDNKTIDH